MAKALDYDFVKQCLDRNQTGDGELYSALHANQFIANVSTEGRSKEKTWYFWNGNIWQEDFLDASKKACEAVAEEYDNAAAELRATIPDAAWKDKNHEEYWKVELHKKFKARSDKVRTYDHMFRIPEIARTVNTKMAAKEEQFNSKKMLLPCANGVIDLDRGALLKGDPSDLMNKQIDIAYNPTADQSPWLAFLKSIIPDQRYEEISTFLQRSFGYALTGQTREQYIWIFSGPGRNGKGVLFNLISEILGPFFHQINSAMLLLQKFPPGPQAASQHVYSLLGKRLVVGSETPEGAQVDADAIKRLTGEDELNCRPLHRAEIIFRPTHTLMLRTNHIPTDLTKDFALRERLLPINFPYMFVEDLEKHKRREPQNEHLFRPINKKLKAALQEHKAGILSWMVEGCLLWQRDGLNPPPSVLQAVESMNEEEDYYYRFAAEFLLPAPENACVPAKDCRTIFCWWWVTQEGCKLRTTPTERTLYSELRKRGYAIERRPNQNAQHIFGVSVSNEILDIASKFVESINE